MTEQIKWSGRLCPGNPHLRHGRVAMAKYWHVLFRCEMYRSHFKPALGIYMLWMLVDEELANPNPPGKM